MGMGNAFGLSRMMGAVPNALNAVEARRDRASNRERMGTLQTREDEDYARSLEDRRRQLRQEKTAQERAGVKWEQGQEDRGTRLGREETQYQQGQQASHHYQL